jgi:hypothetical protein
MPTPEKQLLQKIKEAEVEQVNARQRIVDIKRAAMDAETLLIECNLHQERLVEELRVLRLRAVDREPTPDEKDIARFRLVLPDLLKKI